MSKIVIITMLKNEADIFTPLAKLSFAVCGHHIHG